eukprot:1182754-Prorocentrum_minimum.AAC.3
MAGSVPQAWKQLSTSHSARSSSAPTAPTPECGTGFTRPSTFDARKRCQPVALICRTTQPSLETTSAIQRPKRSQPISDVIPHNLVRCVDAVVEAGYIPSALVWLVHLLGIFPLPSCGWFIVWVYSLCPRVVGSLVTHLLALRGAVPGGVPQGPRALPHRGEQQGQVHVEQREGGHGAHADERLEGGRRGAAGALHVVEEQPRGGAVKHPFQTPAQHVPHLRITA